MRALRSTRGTIVAVACFLAACTTPALRRTEATTDIAAAAPAHVALRLIGRQTLAHRLRFGGTTVGGLSGIDYDPVADLYYLISDDRSGYSPTRFYTARLAIDAERFDDAALQTVVTLRRPDDTPYGPGDADAEAIRYDPVTHDLWWSSEGERGARRIDPFVRRSTLDGRYAGEVPLDPMFRIGTEARGPRDNLVFEGISLSPDHASLWVSMEAPLLEDGPPPTPEAGAWSRISRYDRRPDGGFGTLAAQFAYPIEPVPAAGAWTTWLALNGVAEILVEDATTMLVLERAFVIGAGWRIRLFEADWRAATDVRSIASLAGPPPGIVPMAKREVLDFDTLGIAIDNLEGLCFGPTLANGHRTLVLVADDNFNPGQVTQLLAFEVLPR